MERSGSLIQVSDIHVETEDARTFELTVPPHLVDIYRGSAGQFVRILIPGDPPELARSYSLSSSPDLGEPLRITVKRVKGGTVSERLVEKIELGQMLNVEPPAGLFTLKQTDLPLLLIAGGSGITPIFSLMKTALHTTKRSVRLFYASRNLESEIFRTRFDALLTAFPDRLAVRRHYSDLEGFVTEADIHQFVRQFPRSQVYVCGPMPLMDLVEQVVGLPDLCDSHELISERFGAGVQPNISGLDEAPATANVVIRFDGNEYNCVWSGAGSLLDAALSADLPIPFSCREGKCGTCKGRLTEGEIIEFLPAALSKRERSRNNILACCSKPKSQNVAIEYD